MNKIDLSADFHTRVNRTENQEFSQPEAKGYKIPPDLLLDLKSGNQQAFETVYLHYVSSVKRFLKVLVRQEEVAEEITQDVFVTLWEKRDHIDPEKNVSAYIYTIAKNYAFKHFNRNKAFSTEDLRSLGNADNGVTPDTILIQKEKEILIEIAVKQMPPQRRKVYRMSRVEGLTNGEIAERLQISKNTVENHITTALKELREVLSSFLSLIL